MQNSKKEILTIALRLLAICSIVAVIIAFINTITKDRIAYNQMLSTAEALSGIYSSEYDGKAFTVNGNEFVINDGNTIVAKCSQAQSYTPQNSDVTAIYLLTDRDDNTQGYCVSIAPMGFKAEIQMLVAVNADMTVKGVKIVSMSDTSGIGTKAQDPSFLAKFDGLGSEEAAKVDIISGATKTSKPVIQAVSLAIKEASSYMNDGGAK